MSFITYDNLEGARLGFLEVKRLVRRNPDVVYEAYCHNCKTTTTYRHEYLRDIGVCKGRECTLIAERKAAQQTRDAYRPKMQTTRPLPPEDYRAWPAFEKILAEWERQQQLNK
jgi:hypothetical protein